MSVQVSTAIDPAALVIDPAAADLLFREARSVNRFADETVTDAQVHAAYDLLRWGPTAWNAQPLRLLLVRSPEARERLATHLTETNRAKTLAAPLTLVAAADPSFHEHINYLAPHAPDLRDRFEADGEESRAEMARTSGLIQVGYLIAALRAAGLQAGPIGGFDATGLDKEFFTELGWRSLLVMNVGQPAAEKASHRRAPRLEFEQVSTTI